MDDEILEGEIIDLDDSWMDPRIAFEVEDFRQRMDKMQQAYRFAADMIRSNPYQPPRKDPQEPVKGFALIRICGEGLIAAGAWLLSKYPFHEGGPLKKQQSEDWAWARETDYERSVRLPPPDFNSIRSVQDD